MSEQIAEAGVPAFFNEAVRAGGIALGGEVEGPSGGLAPQNESPSGLDIKSGPLTDN